MSMKQNLTEYNELKEYSFSKDMMTYPLTEQIKSYEKEISKILQTQRKRIHFDIKHDKIIIDVTRNRNVAINLPKLFRLQELFKADDIIISTPIRCKIVLQIKRRKHERGILETPSRHHNCPRKQM